eukprot:g14796.t1
MSETELSALVPNSSRPRRLSVAETLPAMQLLGSATTITVGSATCNIQVLNNTYVKCGMSAARRASRAEPEDGELRGKIISEHLGEI